MSATHVMRSRVREHVNASRHTVLQLLLISSPAEPATDAIDDQSQTHLQLALAAVTAVLLTIIVAVDNEAQALRGRRRERAPHKETDNKQNLAFGEVYKVKTKRPKAAPFLYRNLGPTNLHNLWPLIYARRTGRRVIASCPLLTCAKGDGVGQGRRAGSRESRCRRNTICSEAEKWKERSHHLFQGERRWKNWI